MTDIPNERLPDLAASLRGREIIIVLPVAHQFGAVAVPVSGCQRALTDDIATERGGGNARDVRKFGGDPLGGRLHLDRHSRLNGTKAL